MSLLYRAVLTSIGWHEPPDDIVKQHQGKKIVYVFPHTSYWDFVLMILYRGAYPSVFKDIYFVVRPQSFVHFGSFLRSMNCLPASASQDRGAGAVATIVNALQDKTSFWLLVSPEGKRIASPWRSGYYHIAKEFGASLGTMGFDYERHTMNISPKLYSCDEPYSEVEAKLQADLHAIIPLYPECSYTPVRRWKSTSPMDWVTLSHIIAGPYPLYLLWSFDKLAFLVGLSSTCVSFLYHYEDLRYRKLDMTLVVATISVFLFKIYRAGKLFNPWFLISSCLTVYSYYRGCGRHCNTDRSPSYNRYHTLFHYGIGASIISALRL